MDEKRIMPFFRAQWNPRGADGLIQFIVQVNRLSSKNISVGPQKLRALNGLFFAKLGDNFFARETVAEVISSRGTMSRGLLENNGTFQRRKKILLENGTKLLFQWGS